ncbi:PREDICTED: uncharacterized protein LOC109231671 [Nicotiana attenuata]|uniref:uncharacterized protein LOC109231671 n=1 Tax=Nicotiana attenuata TaxID=49451 RepID=UPI0009055868|nr:PREDICTED: uncharacterized protein LOC109231671 [Nicotiana attenuata]
MLTSKILGGGGGGSWAIAEIIGEGTRAPAVAILGPSIAPSSSIPAHANNSRKEQLAEWEKSIQSSGNRRKLSWADEAELQEKQQTQLPSSVWDNFDIAKFTNAGFKLEYVSPEIEVDRQIGEIEAEDIESEIEYRRNVVVCYVLGVYPPFNVLNSYLQRIWGKHGIDKIAMLKNGIVMVRFDSEVGKNDVIQEGIFHFDNEPFIVKAWIADMEFSKDELFTVPIWIRLLGLEFKYWSVKGLSKIGSPVGKPLVVDKNTEKKLGLNFARLLVEVKIGDQIPKTIYFKNEKGVIVEQRVTCDWKPSVMNKAKEVGKPTPETDTMKIVQGGGSQSIGSTSKQTEQVATTEPQNQVETGRDNRSGKDTQNPVMQGDERNRKQQGTGWNHPQKHANVHIVIKDVVTVTNTFKALEKIREEKEKGSQGKVGSQTSLTMRDG